MPRRRLELLSQNLFHGPGHRGAVLAEQRPIAESVELLEVDLDLSDLLPTLDDAWVVVAVVLEQRFELRAVLDELLLERDAGLLVPTPEPHRLQEDLLAERLLDRHQALAEIVTPLHRLDEGMVGGLECEPLLLRVDERGVELDRAFHERMGVLAIVLDAEVADPLADREVFPLLVLDLGVDRLLLPAERFDERAGLPLVRLFHEPGVGLHHGVEDGSGQLGLRRAEPQVDQVRLPNASNLERIRDPPGDQFRILGAQKRTLCGLEDRRRRLEHERACEQLLVRCHRGQLVAARGE